MDSNWLNSAPASPALQSPGTRRLEIASQPKEFNQAVQRGRKRAGDTTTRPKPAKKARTVSTKSQAKVKVASKRKRKHKTYLSATQIAERDAHTAFKSQELNLMLDVNDLRQTIRMYEERRDLHVTRLMLSRHYYENEVFRVMEKYFRVFGAVSRRRTCSELAGFLSRVDPCMLDSSMDAKGTLPFFVWKWGCYNNHFSHWEHIQSSTRIVTFIEEDNIVDGSLTKHGGGEQYAFCSAGGCVVESIGEFTGRPTREMVAVTFPHLLSDEGYTAALTRLTLRFPTRILVYFDARGNIVNNVLEADAFGALLAILEANASSETRLDSENRFTELPADGNLDVDMEAPSAPSTDENSHCEAENDASSSGSHNLMSYLLN